MKAFKVLAATLLAALSVFASCEKVDQGGISLKLDPTTVTLDSSDQTTATINVKASQGWVAVSSASWISLDKTSGSQGTTKLTLTIAENKSNDRSGKVTVSLVSGATTLATSVVTISQKGALGEITPGEGTVESPYSVAKAVEEVAKLEVTTAPADIKGKIEGKYVRGTIYKIDEQGGSYKNATYYISDSGEESDTFIEVYRGKGIGGEDIIPSDYLKTGDVVVVTGTLIKFGEKYGTPEFTQGSTIYSLNSSTTPIGGSGSVTIPAVFTTATVKQFSDAADDQTIWYKLSGTIGGSINTSYGNFDLTDETGTVYIYGTQNITDYASKLVSGNKVVLYCNRYVFQKTGEADKLEGINAIIESIEGGELIAKDPIEVSIADFLKAEDSETQPYKITGVITNGSGTDNKKFDLATYGNFDLKDETGSVYVYGLAAEKIAYGASNPKNCGTLNLNEGDNITIIGYKDTYNSLIEVVSAYFVSKNASGNYLRTTASTVAVEASATSAVIEVEANVAWTAVAPEGASLSTTSGNGNGTITVSFAANTGLADKEYAVTISTTAADVPNKTITVTVRQEGAPDPAATSASFNLNNTLIWGKDTHATYKTGYYLTRYGVRVAYYQNTSTTLPVEPTDLVKFYKNHVMIVTAPAGKTISKIVFKSDLSEAKYCLDLNDPANASAVIATADKDALTITYVPSGAPANQVAFIASNGQVRVNAIEVQY